MSSSVTITSQAKLDMILGGLVSTVEFWQVHLGTTSPTISPANSISDFADPFYPEYAIGFWDPEPFVVNPDYSVSATGGSVSFAAPSQMPFLLTTVWVTYTDADGHEQLLESWYVPGAPVQFGPGGAPYVVNLGFSVFNAPA